MICVGPISRIFVTSHGTVTTAAFKLIWHFSLCTLTPGRENFKWLITNFNWHLEKKKKTSTPDKCLLKAVVYSTISSFLTAERNPCACIFSCFPSWSSRLERPFSHFGQGLPPSYCWVTWGWLRRKILRTVTWKPETKDNIWPYRLGPNFNFC